jgi:hypothetical protein
MGVCVKIHKIVLPTISHHPIWFLPGEHTKCIKQPVSKLFYCLASIQVLFLCNLFGIYLSLGNRLLGAKNVEAIYFLCALNVKKYALKSRKYFKKY